MSFALLKSQRHIRTSVSRSFGATRSRAHESLTSICLHGVESKNRNIRPHCTSGSRIKSVLRLFHRISLTARYCQLSGIGREHLPAPINMDNLEPTSLLFHHDGDLTEQEAHIKACVPYDALSDADKQLYKDPPANLHAVAVDGTIFHPQGGGQPSDIGHITSDGVSFKVLSARTSVSHQGVVLHFGTFESQESSFKPGAACKQEINAEKRLLFSKYHTAGHVLGSAVRHLLEKEVSGFDELKASHFPDSASCEFAGLIAGSHKEAIQAKLDEFIAAAMPVKIDWWAEEEFHREGVARLIPDKATREAMGVKPGEKFRVVKIVGAEVYPCGGTHVHRTDQCRKTVVRKIGRSKGTSRVSYTLPDA